ncbi:hypothetical protein E4T39_02559 [Aureobasidium subglaciale]|nr:hypothetical protein E4T39_02559 [Aureobasidium subglaciale]
MEEFYDYGPDLLSDRVSFQALIDELYPTDSKMQLDVEFSSRGTSPTGPDTPPSSSGGQEEIASPEEEHERQSFAPGALMTEMLAGVGGYTSNDVMRPGASIYHGLDTIDPSSFHDPYLEVSSPAQQPDSQMPAYTWHTLPEVSQRYESTYTANLSWANAALAAANLDTLPYHTAAQPRYIELSPPEVVIGNAGYQIGLPPTNLTDFDMLQQSVSATDCYPRVPVINHNHNTPSQPPTMIEGTGSFAIQNTPHVEIADPTIRNNTHRSREQNTSRSPEATRRSMVPRPSSSRGSSPRAPNKGGRSGGLDDGTRAHANQMRKLGACWICAFQRDQCDPGSPCTRCQDRSIRGSLHMLPCLRIHLQELVHQFLPATMNRQHRREEIILFAEKSLGFWRADAAIQVHLTSLGMGQFVWNLHEYEPSSKDLLLQKRYKVGLSGTWQRVEKRSPPLALKQVNFSQTHKLEEYVDRIVDRYLQQFQDQAYYGEEDSCAMFQNELLRALCSLYTSLPDEDDDKTLKGDLRHVIRMLILTCIMDHPITIVDAQRDTTIRMMQSHNNPQVYEAWTSPMLANRQLKYFFSEMQTQQYNKSLNRLHQILRKAGDKNKLWMSSFVLMLGIALVLEQCQHLLWIKADAKVAKREVSPIDAEWEARTHCREMDDGFEFLCKLYHCKYRGKHREKTRYEELKNKVSNAAEAEFADKIYDIVDRNGGYLLHRQSLTIWGMRENNHVSRLVARFLVELMGLTQSSP